MGSADPGFSLSGAEKQVYKIAGDARLHLHIFRPQGWTAGDSRPAIVFFFGGGWTGGTPEQFLHHCEYLAGQGMVAVSAEYRVHSRHGTDPFAAIADAKSAVRWLRAHARALGVDPQRIAASGGSAGGHVAACAGCVPGLEDSCEDLAVSSMPNALVLFNPVIDTMAKEGLRQHFGDRAAEASPQAHVRPGLPPTILFNGEADPTTPVTHARDFAAAMVAAGNRCELHTYPGESHGFFNWAKKEQAYYTLTMSETHRFLASLGYMDGEPAVEAQVAAEART